MLLCDRHYLADLVPILQFIGHAPGVVYLCLGAHIETPVIADRGRLDAIPDLETYHMKFHAASKHHAGRSMADDLQAQKLLIEFTCFSEAMTLHCPVRQRVGFDYRRSRF